MSSNSNRPEGKKPERDPRNRSKADLRQELEQAIHQFLHGGGKVNEIPTGTSAWLPGSRPAPPQPLFTQPPVERTPLDDVVAALDERRAKKRSRTEVKRARKPKAKRRVIYDDFGEPLRRVWADD